MNYKGFEIDSRHRIFKNGKQIFTASHQYCYSEQDAMAMIDLSLSHKQEVLKKNTPEPGEIIENINELDYEKECEKIEQYYLIEHENLDFKN